MFISQIDQREMKRHVIIRSHNFLKGTMEHSSVWSIRRNYPLHLYKTLKIKDLEVLKIKTDVNYISLLFTLEQCLLGISRLPSSIMGILLR